MTGKKKWPKSRGCRETEYRFSFLCNCHKIRLIGAKDSCHTTISISELPLQVSAFALRKFFIFKKSACVYTPLFLCSLKCADRISLLCFPLLPPPWLLHELEILEALADIFESCLSVLLTVRFLFLFSIFLVAFGWSQAKKGRMLSSGSQVCTGSFVHSFSGPHSSSSV